MARYTTDKIFVDSKGNVHHERKNMMTGGISRDSGLESTMKVFMDKIRSGEVAPPHCLRKYKS